MARDGIDLVQNQIDITGRVTTVPLRFMKPHLLGNVLVGIAGLTILIVVALCYAYVQDVRQSRRLQGQLILATMNRNRAQALAADAQEFAKKNKQMEALLQSLSRLPVSATNNATRLINARQP